MVVYCQRMSSIALQDLSYPVYVLPDKPIVEEGVLYYYSENEKNGVLNSKILIVDDASLPGNSLAARRLSLAVQKVPLYKLNKAIFFLGDLIKIATTKNYFIDSNGKLFNYKKITGAKLKFYRIAQVISIRTGGAIIEVESIPNRFKVLNTPELNVKYAGVLHIGMATVLYGLYAEKPEDTRRKV